MAALMDPPLHLPHCQSALTALITGPKKVNSGQHPGSRLEYHGNKVHPENKPCAYRILCTIQNDHFHLLFPEIRKETSAFVTLVTGCLKDL
jgi:hypothetical protein